MNIRKLFNNSGFYLELDGMYINFDTVDTSEWNGPGRVILYKNMGKVVVLTVNTASEFGKKWEIVKSEINN